MKQVLTVILVLLLSAAPALAQQVKIGHFDLQRLVALSDAGKQAREQHSARARKYQEDIDTRSNQLKSLKEAIEQMGKGIKAGDTLPAALVEKDKEYGTQARELQRLLGGYQEELKLYDTELTRKVVEEFTPVLADYAQKNGYDYILRYPEAMAYASEKHDITTELVTAFNKKRRK